DNKAVGARIDGDAKIDERGTFARLTGKRQERPGGAGGGAGGAGKRRAGAARGGGPLSGAEERGERVGNDLGVGPFEGDDVDRGSGRGRRVEFIDQGQHELHRLRRGGEQQTVAARLRGDVDVFEVAGGLRRGPRAAAEEAQRGRLGLRRRAAGG